MKKRSIIFFVLVLLLGIGVDKFVITNKREDLSTEKSIQKKNTRALSMMLETGAGTGVYEQTTRESWPTDGYKFNAELSKCENGGKLSWNSENNTVVMTGSTSDKCYVYFDKIELKLELNNYTFSWNAIDKATTYKIYNNNILLTTTNNTNIDLYTYFYNAGTYAINVKAFDDSENVIIESNPINYALEQTDTSFITESYWLVRLNKQTSEYGRCQGKENYSCWSLSNRIINAYNTDVSLLSINDNYLINYFNSLTYQENNVSQFGNQLQGLSGYGFYSQNGEDIRLSLDYCKKYTCFNSTLANISYLDNGNTYFYDSSSKQLSVTTSSTTSHSLLIFQLIEFGKAPSDWYVLNIWPSCLSENTYIYVYDRKRKKLKRKRIGNIGYDDEILCWNFDDGVFALEKPIWIMKERRINKYNLLKFSDGSELETIEEHRIYNKEKGKFTYPMTFDTPIGTTTFNSKGEYITLVDKKVIEKSIKYYNIIINKHINLFANGILTSCRLNNIYPIEDMKFVKEEVINNNIDFSVYDEKIVKGLRLVEQSLNESDIKTYVDNLIKNQK